MALLLIFAQLEEAKFALEYLEAKPIHHNFYSFAYGYIAISGLGMVAAILTLAKYIEGIDHIWNIGFAGSLTDSYPIGSLHRIGQVNKYNYLPLTLDAHSHKLSQQLYPEISFPNGGVSLITTDFPIHDAMLRRQLSTKADLVDMEGYGVAAGAFAFQKPCTLWKIVSDFASPSGRSLIIKHMNTLSELLAKEISHQLDAMRKNHLQSMYLLKKLR